MLRRPKCKTVFRYCSIKSDRINAIRKQYESFLEDDKKRKERNDYILGRLDKMRHNSMAVLLHQTPTTNREFFPPSYSRHFYQTEKLEPRTIEQINIMQMVQPNQEISRPSQSLPLDVPRSYNIEEMSILKEISKKYILIPKLRTNFLNASLDAISAPITEPHSSITAKDIDNNDWKSKYDILNKIKSNENEEVIQQSGNQNEPSRTCDDQVLKNYDQKDLITTYENEIPVKDVPDQMKIENDLKSLEHCVITKKNDQMPSFDGSHELDTGSTVMDKTAFYNDQTQSHDLYKNVKAIEKVENDSQAEKYALAHERSDKGTFNENQETYREHEFPIEYDQFIPEPVTKTNPAEAAIVQLEEESTAPTKTTLEDVVMDENVVSTFPNENLGDIAAGIEEFDAEQNEMFHDKDTDENYSNTADKNSYYEQDGTCYAEYSQNENYPQSQQYAYYEQPEQEFNPTEINELEEIQMQYDPTYGQQYEGNYEQEQEQNVYNMESDPNQIPNEQAPMYDLSQQMQDFDGLVHGPQAETVQNVEQVLDQQDEFVDKSQEQPTLKNEILVTELLSHD